MRNYVRTTCGKTTESPLDAVWVTADFSTSIVHTLQLGVGKQLSYTKLCTHFVYSFTPSKNTLFNLLLRRLSTLSTRPITKNCY